MKLRMICILCVSLTCTFSFAAKKSPSERLVRDSQRQQALKASAKIWFERKVLPHLRSQLHSLDQYDVQVQEPVVVLPPSLGGPIKYTQVLLRAQFSGFAERTRRHGFKSRYGLPEYGPVNCRFEQRLSAEVDPKSGKAVRILSKESPQLFYACASPGVEWLKRKGHANSKK
ncbi:hypothetical protein GW916_11005 [bacterium]|nr:hypothetical protein [bacterium]